jgi:hypothetical protein
LKITREKKPLDRNALFGSIATRGFAKKGMETRACGQSSSPRGAVVLDIARRSRSGESSSEGSAFQGHSGKILRMHHMGKSDVGY